MVAGWRLGDRRSIPIAWSIDSRRRGSYDAGSHATHGFQPRPLTTIAAVQRRLAATRTAGCKHLDAGLRCQAPAWNEAMRSDAPVRLPALSQPRPRLRTGALLVPFSPLRRRQEVCDDGLALLQLHVLRNRVCGGRRLLQEEQGAWLPLRGGEWGEGERTKAHIQGPSSASTAPARSFR